MGGNWIRAKGNIALTNKRNGPKGYIAQLDSFRFVAVFLVIVKHWAENSWVNKLPNAFLGVTFFFVLSGFLISGILFDLRGKKIKNTISLSQALKQFYVRRTLRIFPLYYFVIFWFLFFIPTVFEGKSLWFIFYVSNFLIYITREWPGMLSHFWSLAVEEQFYLLWPIVLLLTPARALLRIIFVVIILSLSFKFYSWYTNDSFFNVNDVLPLSCFDAFGVGAALSYINKFKPGILQSRILPNTYLLILVNIIAGAITYNFGISFLFGLFVSFGSAVIINKTLTGFNGLPGLVLNSSPMMYLGRISYGLYVYHNFCPWLLRCFTGTESRYILKIKFLNESLYNSPIMIFILQFILLVMVSSISWFLIERPILSFKRFFNS